ncbi:hypothetical protein GCM10027612_72600 [Microbispora bryophytorum subsp. camponoti]
MPELFSRSGLSIRSVSVARPSLDDVFMSYTGRSIRDAESSGGARGPAALAAARGGRR